MSNTSTLPSRCGGERPELDEGERRHRSRFGRMRSGEDWGDPSPSRFLLSLSLLSASPQRRRRRHALIQAWTSQQQRKPIVTRPASLSPTMDTERPQGPYLGVREVSPLFRIEFILSRYRRNGQPFLFYLRSLLGLHNEAGNVWTHLLGAIFIGMELWRFRQDFAVSAPFDTAMVTLFGAISVFLHLVSSSAHLFHSHSSKTHLVVCCCDYACIGIDGFAYNVIGYCFYSLPSYYRAMRAVILPVSIVMSFMVSAALAFALASRRRDFSWKVLALMLSPAVCFFVIGLGPVWHKLLLLLWHRHSAVEMQAHHLIHPTLLALSLFFFVSKIPERWAPGRFDLLGHSHQWFHIGVTLSQWFVIRGVRTDLASEKSVLCSQRDQQFSMQVLWFIGFALTGLNVVFIFLLYKRYHGKSE